MSTLTLTDKIIDGFWYSIQADTAYNAVGTNAVVALADRVSLGGTVDTPSFAVIDQGFGETKTGQLSTMDTCTSTLALTDIPRDTFPARNIAVYLGATYDDGTSLLVNKGTLRFVQRQPVDANGQLPGWDVTHITKGVSDTEFVKEVDVS